MSNSAISEYNQLLSDLKARVATSRYKAALSVNKELILLYQSYWLSDSGRASEQRLGRKNH